MKKIETPAWGTKQKIALGAIFFLSIFLILVLLFSDKTRITSLEFKIARLFNLKAVQATEETADTVLDDAHINHESTVKNSSPFIVDKKNGDYAVYYKKDSEYHCVILRTKGVAKPGAGFTWGYTQKGNKLFPYVELDKSVLCDPEHFDIMLQRPHVEIDGELFDTLKSCIPFDITNDECFFVIEETTREEGWFYFKFYHEGEVLVGCYSVEGWSSRTTYEELINMNKLEVENVSNGHIKLSNK